MASSWLDFFGIQTTPFAFKLSKNVEMREDYVPKNWLRILTDTMYTIKFLINR